MIKQLINDLINQHFEGESYRKRQADRVRHIETDRQTQTYRDRQAETDRRSEREREADIGTRR